MLLVCLVLLILKLGPLVSILVECTEILWLIEVIPRDCFLPRFLLVIEYFLVELGVHLLWTLVLFGK